MPMSDLVLEQLDSLGAAYELVVCDPDLADTAAFCEAYGYATDDSAKPSLLLASLIHQYSRCALFWQTVVSM